MTKVGSPPEVRTLTRTVVTWPGSSKMPSRSASRSDTKTPDCWELVPA
jgi:hypothetical protein